MAWQSTAALHVKSMSDNCTVRPKSSTHSSSHSAITATCNTFHAPHHMSMMRWKGVLPRNSDFWEQWPSLRGLPKHDKTRATTPSKVPDGNQKPPTEQKKHQKHVEPTSLATDWPSQPVRWYTWKRCWPEGGEISSSLQGRTSASRLHKGKMRLTIPTGQLQ